MTAPTSRHSGAPVRLALVGLGGHGRTLQAAAEAAAEVAVVAVYDTVEAERKAAAARFGCAAAPSYDRLLARDDVEAVVLATPNPLHRPQVEAALKAGLDVFVEKPIANTVADGRAMLAAAGQARRVLMVGHNMRHARATQTAHSMIRSGQLGTLVSAEFHFSSDAIRQLTDDAWRLRPHRCPLLPVMQLGIHAVDLVHYLLGPVDQVFALARSVTRPSEVVDSVAAAFHVRDGIVGTLVSNYCTRETFVYRLAGTEGTLRCTPHTVKLYSNADRKRAQPPETWDYSAHPLESYVREMEAFARAVRAGGDPEASGRSGLQALAVVEAMQHAVETKIPQEVISIRNTPTT